MTCGLPGTHELFDYKFYKEAKIDSLDWGIMNFDNLLNACLTIFQISTLEGWNKMMYYYYDAFSPALLSIFFIIVVLITSFFILNLMLAAIWSTYKHIFDGEKEKHEK
jgi:hypothetical protein